MTAAQSKPIDKPAYSSGKHLAQQIFHDTMAAIDVRHAMRGKLKLESGVLVAGEALHPLVRNPLVVAFGKAANRMAAVLNEILEGKIEAGVSVSPAETQQKLPNFRYFVGGHPYPNAQSVEGARAALDLGGFRPLVTSP